MAREIKRKTTGKTNTKSEQTVVNTEVKTAEAEAVEVEAETVVETEVVAETVKASVVKATPRKFEQTDLILCRSVTQGEMFYPSKTSGILYRWSAYGDIREVEYRDLYSLKASRSSYLYDPKFVIEDEELLADPRWSDIKKLYEDMYESEDLGAILELSVNEFEKVLKQMPNGLKQAIAIEVASRVAEGTFDSIKKVQIVNKICDTELAVE